MIITFVYDVLFGYIGLSMINGICTKAKESGEPVNSVFGFDRLRCLRVHHLEYWHPNQLQPMKAQLGGYRIYNDESKTLNGGNPLKPSKQLDWAFPKQIQS